MRGMAILERRNEPPPVESETLATTGLGFFSGQALFSINEGSWSSSCF